MTAASGPERPGVPRAGGALSAHVRASSFEIHTRPNWRRIICRYEVPVEVLPGFVHTFRFHIETEKPYIVEPAPRFL